MMRRIMMTVIIALLFAESLHAAAVPDDDSAVFSPYPEQPQVQQETQPTQPAPKKAAPKKSAPKKKTPAKKPAPKKAAPKKTAPARQSSLQKGIELMQQDRYEQARPYLLKAIQEERNNPNAWYWYGVYHEKTGGFYQAQYFYTKAVTIDPAFEPLSRVVFYPEDPEKTPLWDPKRPARVYPVETANVPLNVSRFPNAPNDPEVPKVPVYTPPEPGSSPLDGDSWNPAVYVPPSPEELTETDGQSPVYLPPDAESVIADGRQTLEIPAYTPDSQIQRPDNDQIITDRDRIMRVDKPLYNPPAPGQKVAQRPAPQPEQPRKAVSIPTKSAQGKKSATVPESRVVRQSQKKSTPAVKTQSKTPAKQTRKSQPAPRAAVSQDVRPQTPRQQNQTQTPRQQTQTPTPTPTPPARQPQPEASQPQRRQNEYMPPVGQYAPDPGTISDRPIPPVGQGNQN